MAKSTKNAVLICVIMTVVAVAGSAAGIFFKQPIAVIIGMLPAVGYELYRTEGVMTKIITLCILVILMIEVALVGFGVELNIGKYITQYAGMLKTVDAKLLGPVVMAVLSVALLRYTYGVYTKWLAVIILLASAALLFSLDPVFLKSFVKPAVKEGMRRVPGRI